MYLKLLASVPKYPNTFIESERTSSQQMIIRILHKHSLVGSHVYGYPCY